MTHSSLKVMPLTKSARQTIGFFIFALLTFQLMASPFLYATGEVTVKEVSGSAQYVVTKADGSQEEGEIEAGQVLPSDATILVPEGSEVVLIVDGKEIELIGPVSYDVASGEQAVYAGGEESQAFPGAQADIEADEPSRST